MEKLIDKISDTAFLSAYYRSQETTQSQPLFYDPYALMLADAKGRKLHHYVDGNNQTPVWANAVRTYLIDSLILETLKKNPIDTIVNLGCGLDSRPYRLDLPPHLRWIEVDLSEVISYKQKTLHNYSPKCHLSQIAVDLSDASKRHTLFSQINQESKNILILTEAILPFLEEVSNQSLANDLKSFKHFCFWIMDIHSPLSKKLMPKQSQARLSEGNGDLKFAPATGTRFYRDFGWKEKEYSSILSEGGSLHRLPTGTAILNRILTFLPKSIYLRLNRVYGVALLERTE